MTLDEYTAEALASIYAFRNYWKQMYAQYPDRFPLEFESGDWWERFDAFLDIPEDER